MIRTAALIVAAPLLSAAPANAADAQPLTPGVVLTASARYKGGERLLPDTHADASGAAIVVRGDGITVDFGGLTLRGTPADTEPDQRRGVGILVLGKNVTIKNVRVHGYKVGLLAKDAPGLTVCDSDFSYNWKQRLRSTPEREDLADWMSFHKNEADEWLRYGAGLYLSGCDGFTVRNVRITGGQCGLMLTRSNRGTVRDCDFSFLSAIGVGLYRSSENRVMHNRLDWCVRGYSHGVYNRGQDSAGILVFEQCDRNVFAYNSVTHGGDGFFLWAGQTTMDTGHGGCDDNLLYGNDFSHAPTNGVEMTFSRNRVVNNLLLECWHGVWGGYSHDSEIARNVFGFNAESVAIEHGRDIALSGNTFFRERSGVRLWRNAKQDPEWGYPKHNDTRSRDYRIVGNVFDGLTGTAVSVRDTTGVRLENNRYARLGAPALTTVGDTAGLVSDAPPAGPKSPDTPPPTMLPSGNALVASEADPVAYRARFREVAWNPRPPRDPDAPAPLKGSRMPFLPADAPRGRRFILVDQWGPYDFRAPRLVRREPVAGTPNAMRFDVLGPKGEWRIVSRGGAAAALSAEKGSVPGDLRVTLAEGADAAGAALDLMLEYVGAATTDYRGITTPAGVPVRFGYQKAAVVAIDWRVRWHRWTADADPRTAPDAFAALLNGEPIKTARVSALDYAGSGAFASGLPPDRYATVAEGTFTLAKGGVYVLDTLTDDGLRVFVDGKPVLTDAWKYQGPTPYVAELTLSPGPHTLRVEHFQIDGYAALKVVLRPRDD